LGFFAGGFWWVSKTLQHSISRARVCLDGFSMWFICRTSLSAQNDKLVPKFGQACPARAPDAGRHSTSMAGADGDLKLIDDCRQATAGASFPTHGRLRRPAIYLPKQRRPSLPAA